QTIFSDVVGCIVCTHVAIVRPNEDQYIYVNRKQYHSLNVQLICDEHLKIMNVVVRFPGSAQDAHIWRQCNMAQLMETIYRENKENLFFLLGDSGYPLRPWLLTPLRNTIPGTPEDRNIPPLDIDDEVEPDYGININAEEENPNENVNEDLLAARQLRQKLINNYFNPFLPGLILYLGLL
ncbi:hypothetical protein NQ314_014405, partial [Rhamnusium bicolor]